MEKQMIRIFLFIFLFSFVSIFLEANAKGGNGYENKVKLFVFGDSYADTGNTKKAISYSWKPPYGLTFTGNPTGRFSDGRLLTDYIASYLGIRTPIAYEFLSKGKKLEMKNGVNFAYGGSGVFKTLYEYPNMSTQIDSFQQLISNHKLTKFHLHSSVALVSLAGNDYDALPANLTTAQELKAFTTSLIDQLAMNLKRLHELGVPKIGVTAIEPLGCLPSSTLFFSYSNCIHYIDSIAIFYNHILNQTVQKLNDEFRSPVFVIIDLYSAFKASFKSLQVSVGRKKVGNPLVPCCVGVSSEYLCGSVDKSWKKMYEVCKNPELSFFWDNHHPSQNGWQSVYVFLQPSLKQLNTFNK